MTSSLKTKLWVFAAGGTEGQSFGEMRRIIAKHLLAEPTIHRGQWQTLDVAQSPAHATHELRNVSIFYTVPEKISTLEAEVHPDLPWAAEHFEERVGGEPVNPPPSYVRWPHHGGDSGRHLDRQQFSHTYPERFWPKYAGDPAGDGETRTWPNHGIRYNYGDLDQLVGQLVANPLTRQAVLPVWFPEDTGAIDRRVPCSLTYHFMADDDYTLNVWYSLRACDLVRHFHNDVYFAARLLQWICERFRFHVRRPVNVALTPGELNMTISSLHAFVGDAGRLET